MKRVAILGSTGSIGKNALRVAQALRDQVEVVVLAANSSTELLAEQARTFQCRNLVLSDQSSRNAMEKESLPAGCKVSYGPEALVEAACREDVDMVLCAIVGTAGLLPVIRAIQAGKEIALASKEVLVMAGSLVMDLVKKHNTKLIPVDSEHSAIFQCLYSLDSSKTAKIILTCSGGPFRNTPVEEMNNADFTRAVAHPVWSMGQKISVDSASLVNKALEMVEAHFLFDCPEERIDVLIHPQSVIHSMIEFPDGGVLAQLGVPDMRLPIQLAYTWPERVGGGLEKLSLAKVGRLEFFEVDTVKFPAVTFARNAIREGGTLGCVLNAANEVAFDRFKAGLIRFGQIPQIIEKTMLAHNNCKEMSMSLEGILEADNWARAYASELNV
jgi:1-deoxy-D-xylulose-5-phosphate reductoisomerase